MSRIVNDFLLARDNPANIRLDKDILKTSWRRLLSLTSEDVFKTSSRRLNQDQYFRLRHTSWRRLQDVFKTSSRRLAKTSSRLLAKTSSKRLQGVCKNVVKTSSRCLQDVLKASSRHFQDILTCHQVKLLA